MQHNSQAQTEFNDAFGTIGRVNILWQKCHSDRMNMDMASYVDTVISVYAELESEIKDEQSKKMRKELLEIKDTIGYVRKTMTRTGVIPPEIYDGLFGVEIELRQVWDSKGYKTKRAEDPRSALGR